MNNIRIIMSLMVFLLMELPSSSFFLSAYLNNIVAKEEHSEIQLNFAIEQNITKVIASARTKSTLHSKLWLELTKILAKTQGDASYQLANYYQATPEKAIFWYKNSIRFNYQKASIKLAQLYYQQELFSKSIETIDALIKSDDYQLDVEAVILKIKLAINLGKVSDIKHLLSKYSQQLQSVKVGQQLLEDIQQYNVQLTFNQVFDKKPTGEGCENSIQLFATNLNNLKHLEQLIESFKTQPLNDFVCFAPLRYMPINALNCINEKSSPIRCDEINLQDWASGINTRYVGVMFPKGGANVHLGMLYFDEKDNVDVFAHELSHLLGFVDEYPLSVNHNKCQSPQNEMFSHNISVLKSNYYGDKDTIRHQILTQIPWGSYIKVDTPILQPVDAHNGNQSWRLGTPKAFKKEVGLFKSQTCNKANNNKEQNYSSFKPVYNRTKLQYFALDMPPLYLSLLEDNSAQYRMPSFHYNIALAFYQTVANETQERPHNSITQANYWLEQSSKWEIDQTRRKKVRLGEF